MGDLRIGNVWEEGESMPSSPDEYELLEEVGKGATASVWLARVKATGLKVAIKLVDLEAQGNGMDQLMKEAQIMRRLRHPNVLPLYCSFISKCSLWMVMPFVAGGALQQLLRKKYPSGVKEEVLVTIARDVLQGLDYLHRHSCMHRDLKAANLLVHDDGRILLADFGVTATLERVSGDLSSGPSGAVADSASQWARYAARSTFVGTPAYIAPEVMEQAEGYNQSADIWSYGITLLEVAGGRAPHSGSTLRELAMATIHGPPPSLSSHTASTKRTYSTAAQDFVAWCLEKEAEKRPRTADLLRHPWLREAHDSAFLAHNLLGQPDLHPAESLPNPVLHDSSEEYLPGRRSADLYRKAVNPGYHQLDSAASCPADAGAAHAAAMAAWSREVESSLSSVNSPSRPRLNLGVGDDLEEDEEEEDGDEEEEDQEVTAAMELTPEFRKLLKKQLALQRKRLTNEFMNSKTTLLAHQKMVMASLKEKEEWGATEQRKLKAQLVQTQNDFRAARDAWRRREQDLLDQVAGLEEEMDRLRMENQLLDRISGEAWHRELDSTWN